MAKLAELSGWELMSALCEIAEPVGNLVNDDAVWECVQKCTMRAVTLRQKDGLRFMIRAYASLIPALMKDHKADVARLLAVVEGKSVEETMQMNGKELFDDFRAVYREYLEPFFIKSARLANRG